MIIISVEMCIQGAKKSNGTKVDNKNQSNGSGNK